MDNGLIWFRRGTDYNWQETWESGNLDGWSVYSYDPGTTIPTPTLNVFGSWRYDWGTNWMLHKLKS